MALDLRTTCEGCDCLAETERWVPGRWVPIVGYACAHPKFGVVDIGPRPETPGWCPLEVK